MQSDSPPKPQPQPEQEPVVNDMESLLREQEDYTIKHGDIRLGHIIEINDDGALVDVGLKREGFAPAEDLQQLRREQIAEVHVDDEVPVMITNTRASEGYFQVSIHRGLLEKDWLEAERMLRSGEVLEAEISGYNRGGLTIQFGRIRGFIPMSHVASLPRGLRDPERRERLTAMVGQTVGLRVIEVNRQRRRLILSQRQAQRTWQRMRKRRLLEELEKGQRRRGTVCSITDFGIFVDLGGVDGLVHISELSWRRTDDPREVAHVGDEVEVVVIDVDRSRERIGLSIKQTQQDPWKQVGEKYKVNQLVEGRVTRVTDIGAFIELEPGVEGLLHTSELVGAPSVTPQEVLDEGDELPLKVLRVEPARHRIGLSARRVQREEWEEWAAAKAAREADEAAGEEEGPEEPVAIAEPAAEAGGDEADEEMAAAETELPAEGTGEVEEAEEPPPAAEAEPPEPEK